MRLPPRTQARRRCNRKEPDMPVPFHPYVGVGGCRPAHATRVAWAVSMWTLPRLLPGRVRRRAENFRRLVGVPAMQRRPVRLAASVVARHGAKVRYRGSPSSVGVLDSLLRDEGLRVEHREIVEQQGVQQDIVDVVRLRRRSGCQRCARHLARGADPTEDRNHDRQAQRSASLALRHRSSPRTTARHTPEPDNEAGSERPNAQPYPARSAMQ